MPLYITCYSCKKACEFDDARAGKWTACPGCGRSVFLSAEMAQPLVELREIDDGPPARRAARRKRLPERTAPPPRHMNRPERAEEAASQSPDSDHPTYAEAPNAYYHPHCHGTTQISEDVVRQIAADPWGIITSTLCVRCGRYVSLSEVEWSDTHESVSAYRQRLRRDMPWWLTVLRFGIGPFIGVLMGIVLCVMFSLRNPMDGLGVGLILGLLVGGTLGYLVVGWIWQAVALPRVPTPNN